MSLHRFAGAILAAWIAATHCVRAADRPAPPSLAALDAAIARILVEARVPGAALVVIEDGAIVFKRNYGVADLKTGARVDDDTVFRAGSISKSFTAIGVMMLVEERALDLDAQLASLLPDLDLDNAWSKTDPVRLVHALEHTAGLNDIAFRHYLIEGRDTPLSEAVDLYGPYKSRWRPGTLTSYSNAGPVFAGRAIEVASGAPFDEFMSRRLMGPMGMSSAHWVLAPEIKGRIARSYRASDLAEEPFMEIPGRPSGSLNTTAADLARLPLLMLGRGTLDGTTYFTPETAERIETPSSSDAARRGLRYGYALGNVANTEGRAVFYGHDGSIDGFVATFAYAPKIGAGYVIMANSAAEEIIDAARLVRRYLERNIAAPAIDSQPIAERDRRAWTGQYQTMTPRQHLLAAVVGLSQWEGAAFDAGGMTFKGRRWVHVGGGLFQAEGDAAPGLAVIETREGVRIQSGVGAHRRVPNLEMWSKLGAIALFALFLVGGSVYAAVWAPSAAIGRLKNRGGIALRFWPFAALVLATASALVPLALLRTDDLAMLGRPSLAGWAVFGVSLAAPICTLAAAVQVVAVRPDATQVARIFAFASALLAALACLYMAAHGWIGLKIWNA
jgi:CubicO group peptidase (beta-lactamase class C family)